MMNKVGCVLIVIAALNTSYGKIIKPAISKQKYKLERPLIVGDEIKAMGIWKLEKDVDWTEYEKDPKFK
jgi:hypothetical protein